MDGDGLMTARTDAAGSWGFAYDGLRRVKTKTLPGGSTNSAVYDKAGNVISYTDPNGTINYGFDDANNVTSLAEPGGSCTGTVSKCTTFTYDNENRRLATNYPNGVSQVSTYDTSGRVKTLKATKGATVLTDYTYTYTKVVGVTTVDTGLTQKVVDAVTNQRTEFSYDNLNRLTRAVTYDNTSSAYLDDFVATWDANTNRASYWRKGGSTSNYTYNSVDQMTNSPSFSFSYDANGAMTSSTWGFSGTYNTKGQATAITGQGGGTSVAMTYADVGQSERTQAGGTAYRERLIGGLADETTAGVTTNYIMDPQGNLISQKKGSAQSYYLMDKLGSVVALTDSAGALQQRFQYDPWGKLLTTSITTDSAFKYAGGYYDSSTKMYHFGERYYDPNFGIWTQRDTLAGDITDAKAMNRYTYVGGNPIGYVDLTGQKKSLGRCAKEGGTAAVGTAVGTATVAAGIAVATGGIALKPAAITIGVISAGAGIGKFTECGLNSALGLE